MDKVDGKNERIGKDERKKIIINEKSQKIKREKYRNAFNINLKYFGQYK